MKVKMVPHLYQFRQEESGVRRVVEAYFETLPKFGVEMALPDDTDYDIKAVHAGMETDCTVAHVHGLYWSSDYVCNNWEYRINEKVIETVRVAREVTVPSAWVAEPFQRDMHFTPNVVPHGIDWQAWQHNEPNGGYVLFNKNRLGDVCSAEPLLRLASMFSRGYFVTTMLPDDRPQPKNIEKTGIVPHDQMKKLVQSALVYLSVTPETFGIGTLEAMAAGVPVLGWKKGGNIDLVEHGVNGYLARPGNYDDLGDGLEYCIKYRKELGDNGREMAKAWTWEAACQQVYEVYQRALAPDPPTVAVVIPVFNKSEEQVARALDSVMRQTYDQISAIVVVDDGSDDPDAARRAVAPYADRARLVRQENKGVAHARNRGIMESASKYVCCLDADDVIEPDFIKRCVDALEADRGLGIAYTGLKWIKPDGSSGISDWPGDPDYDAQMQGRNQVPTCNVFRRVAWERLGGYRQRFAPKGAGSEDANLWLRMMSCGWRVKKVTAKPLFVYSWGSGQVSGDPSYKEVDWTAWEPYAGKNGDKRHPFASLATPDRISHPVRQYDEPVVSVIIPVGPGHAHHLVNALDSLEAQTFRKWEAIVVWDGGRKNFVENSKGYYEPNGSEFIAKAYPYARQFDDITTEGPQGPGWARNYGAKFARGPFLVFLDADDWLYPQAIEVMLREWNEYKAIVYTDYVGLATVDDPARLDPALQQRLHYYDEKRQEAVIGHRAAEYDCQRAQRQPEGARPWIWCNVTALVPRAWHNEIGGFDEQMPSWEDVDYHYRMARAAKCYIRYPQELLVYRFYTGNRREFGRQEHQKLLQYLREKYERIETMPCSGCGSRKASVNPVRAPAASAQAVYQRQPTPGIKQRVSTSAQDEDFVLCRYISKQRGDRDLYGAAPFDYEIVPGVMRLLIDRKWHFYYGHRTGDGSERFHVHKADMELHPGQFIPVEEAARVMAPPEQTPPPPPPTRQELPELEPVAAVTVDETTGRDFDWPVDERQIVRDVAPPAFDLQLLPGVTVDIATQLAAMGVTSKEDVQALGADGLRAIRGIGEVKANLIIGAIASMDKRDNADA